MSWKQNLGIEDDYIFNEQLDSYFLNLGFYESTMSPRFIVDEATQLSFDKPCLRYDGDWSYDNEGVQRIFINRNEIYVERQTPYRSFDGSSYYKFKQNPTTIEEIEEQLDWLVRKFEY